MRCLTIALLLWPLAGFAAPSLGIPGATVTGQDFTPAGRFAVPLAPWQSGVPVRKVDGPTERIAWEIPENSSTPLQLADVMRRTLEADGYSIGFECDAAECGGFDFRFALDILQSPSMFVDLSAYHYIVAARAGSEVAVLTSRSGTSGFVHLTIIGAAAEAPLAPEGEASIELPQLQSSLVQPNAAELPVPAAVGDVVTQLATTGRAVLADLRFPSGSTELDAGLSEDLSMLARWMKDNPESRIALVGHTDSVGGLDANTRLSRARAQSVAQRLTSEYGIAQNRIEPEGVGYLMPRAPNTTEEGRALNRRVEAVLLDLE